MSNLDFKNFEAYLLAEDKQLFLNNLIPGSEPYFYFTFLHALKSQEKLPVEFEFQLQDWADSSRGANSNKITLLNMFKKFDHKDCTEEDREALITKLKELFYFNFDFNKPNYVSSSNFKEGDSKQSSKFNENLLKLEDHIKKVYTDSGYIHNFSTQSLARFDKKKISEGKLDIFEGYLGAVDAHEIDDYVELLAKFHARQLKERKTDVYSIPQNLYSQLTLPQLKDLAKKIPDLLKDQTFILEYFHREFNVPRGTSVGADLSNEERREILLKIYDWGKTLPQVTQSIALEALDEILQLGIVLNKYSKDLFIEYLKRPARVYSMSNQKNKSNIEGSRNILRWNFFGKSSWISESELIKAYLNEFFRTATSIAPFDEYLETSYLKELYYTAKLYQGEVLSDVNNVLSSDKLKNLSESREITITKSNKQYFRSNDEVVINVQLKNIPNLLVKVFEFNPENYYLKTNQNLEPTVNLDGLITSEEHNFEFKEPPIQKFSRDFTFESISKRNRGIFIIDFIGNGISTRIVIRKGKLTFLETQTVAGQLFQIIDEEKNICSGERTGIWAQGKFYRTDSKARIMIPFSSNQRVPVILVHEDFAERTDIDLKGENYDFTASYLYNYENFLMGNKAKIIAQPRLTLNQQPIGFGVVKECNATITTYNESFIPVHHEFEKLKLSTTEDLEFEFPVPARLSRVTVTIKCSIPKVNSSDSFNFSSQHTINADLHLNRMEFSQIYLRYSNDGYKLHLLGKNGEPKSRVNIRVTLRHQDAYIDISETLQTDNEGCVTLGHLENVNQITAYVEEVGDIISLNRLWRINNHKRLNYPSNIYLVEGDNIVLPLLHSEHSKSKLNFFQTMSNKSDRLYNLLDQLSVADRKLTIKGLKPGSYSLHLKDVNVVIYVEVLKGTYWKQNEQYVATQDCLYNVKNQINNIVVDYVECHPNQDKTDLVIKAYADDLKAARFHIFAGQFIANDTNSMITSLDGLAVSPTYEEIPTNIRPSIVMNNRKLGDEYVYVLDRKNKTRYVGNTLERPQILLKRTFVQDTKTLEEDLNANQDFLLDKENEAALHLNRQRVANKKMMDKRSAAGGSIPMSQNQIDSYLNFLENPALIKSNLRLDENGLITISDFPVSKYSFIQIVATNTVSNVTSIHPLIADKIPTKDLSLKSQMKKDSFYSINRSSTKVSKGDKFQLKDLTSTELQVVDSVTKLFDIQKALIMSNNRSDTEFGGYEFWNFLRNWNTLSTEDKLKKYDKFASHEVNVFLRFKDPEFFAEVIKPFLKNKIEKTLIDFALLEDEQKILELVSAGNVENIPNYIEFSLAVLTLRKNHATVAKAIVDRVEGMAKTIKVQTNAFKIAFDTVLSLKAADGGMPGAFAGGKADRIMQNIAKPQASLASFSNRAPVQMMAQQQAFGVQKSMVRFEEEEMACESKNRAYSDCEQQDDEYCENLAIEENWDGDNDGDFQNMRRALRSGFQELEKTKEYSERNYYEKNYNVNFSINHFWSDLVRHLLEHGLDKPFLSQNFIHAANSHTEMLGVLAFFGVPFAAGNHTYSSYEGRGLQIEAESNAIIFRKEISEGKADIKPEILIAQRFFDPKDRYTESEEDPGVQIEKEVEQYVQNKIYGCKVTVTNCSVASQEVQVLIEIPEGAIPVYQIDYTKSHTITLPSTGNSTLESYFYFPKAGAYKVYPSNVSKNGKVMAIALEKQFDVQEIRKYTNLESLTAVLSQGNESDILNFIKAKNIFDYKVFNASDILWLLKKKDFFLEVIQVFRERSYFNPQVWSFGFFHKDFKSIREYLQSNSGASVRNYFEYINCSLISRDNLKLLEYSPYVNPRVHMLSNEKNQILNNELKGQYQSFVRYLCEVPSLQAEHYLGMVYYCLLQDRIDDAIKFFSRIDAEKVAKNETYLLQYDYFGAYLDFYNGYPKFEVARAACLKYLTYPVLSWRSLFIDIANQLAEFDGDEMIEDEILADSEKKSNLKNAEKEEIITMDLEGTKLNITYQNIKEITLYFYKIDLEILFSRNPFLSQSKDEFAYVKPNHQHRLTINSTELQKAQYEIPPDLQKSNVFIQLRTDNKTLSVTYFPAAIKTQIVENYGQIKITDSEDKPLTKVYIKCFARTKAGKVSFYKDGYTDLRGRFDYATLNSGDVSNIDKFAILVISDELGSLTKEATPPSRLGRVENNLVLKSKNVKYEQYRQDSKVATKSKK